MSDIYHQRNFVELMLRHLFLSPTVLKKAQALGITGDDFLPAGDYQLPAFKILADIALEIGQAPVDLALLAVIIDRRRTLGQLPANIADELMPMLEGIYRPAPIMDAYFLEELPKFIKARRGAKILQSSAGNIDRIHEEYQKVIFPLDSIMESETPVADRFVSPFSRILKKSVCAMIPTGFPSLNAALGGGIGYRELGLIIGHSGGGKCHGKGTEILMADGSTKKVENIVVGDALMGEDSTPRTVRQLARGQEEMCRIVPVKGEPWTCNMSHILSLVVSYNYVPFKQGQVVNMTVREYLSLPFKQRQCLKLYRTGVEFNKQALELDPYLIGLWLGDGSRCSSYITNTDKEVISYMKTWAKENDYKLRISQGITYCFSTPLGETNPLRTEVRSCLTETRDKFIPQKYLINSRKNRLALLAGLIDSDGYYHHGHYEIVSKFDTLARDILFLARSLGFAAYNHKKVATLKSRNYSCIVNRITISGDFKGLPCLIARKKPTKRKQCKNVLRTGFSVQQLGIGDYYGFELKDKHLYLLGDFTVTHNTATGVSFARGAALHGFKVIYCSMEEEKEDIANRLYASVFQVDYTSLHNGSGYMELDQKVASGDEKEKMELLKNNLLIFDLKGLTPMQPVRLKQMVDEYAVKNNFIFQLLIIDQLQFMEPVSVAVGEQEWLKEGRVLKEIDEMSHQPIAGAENSYFATWVLHQAKGKVKIYFSTDEIAGFKGVIHKPETVMGIGRESPVSDDFEFFSLKNRHAKNFRLPMHGDLSLMTFREKSDDIGNSENIGSIKKQEVVQTLMTNNYGSPEMGQLLSSGPPPPPALSTET